MTDMLSQWIRSHAPPIVYWCGIANTVNGAPRTVSPSSPPTTHHPGYLPIGLTFHHGALPNPVSAPPADFAEAPPRPPG
jgi:erythromycin esterase